MGWSLRKSRLRGRDSEGVVFKLGDCMGVMQAHKTTTSVQHTNTPGGEVKRGRVKLLLSWYCTQRGGQKAPARAMFTPCARRRRPCRLHAGGALQASRLERGRLRPFSRLARLAAGRRPGAVLEPAPSRLARGAALASRRRPGAVLEPVAPVGVGPRALGLVGLVLLYYDAM